MAEITNSFPFQFYGTTIEVHMADDGHWYYVWTTCVSIWDLIRAVKGVDCRSIQP
jgi:hypothetical protein